MITNKYNNNNNLLMSKIKELLNNSYLKKDNPNLEKGIKTPQPFIILNRYGRPIMKKSHLKVDRGDDDKEESMDEDEKIRL